MLAQVPAGTTRSWPTVVGYRLRSVLLDEPTAIVHDWFQGFHGSERVVDTIRSGFFGEEGAPDILTFAAARQILPDELAARIVRESQLSSLPGVRQVGHEAGRW